MFGSPVQNPVYAMSTRSLADRPDDFTGEQVHVVYAVPQGGTDQQLDVTSKIPYSLGAINRWLETQIGRKVKFDTFQGDLDIQFVQLPRTDAQYSATSNKLAQIRFDIPPSDSRTLKNLLIFYEGTGSAEECGRGTQPTSAPVVAPQYAAIFLKGGGRYPCWSEIAASADAPPGLDDNHAMHEIFHGFGAGHAPFATATPGTDEYYKQECDLMYPFGTTECLGRLVLDPFRQLYYNPAGFSDGRLNTYDSKFLTPPPK